MRLPLLALALSLPAIALADLPYAIVDTGQQHCFDDRGGIVCPKRGNAWSGQDGEWRGNAPQYLDNGDGTVTDRVTGLIWQQAFKQVRWADAAADAQADRTGGHADWRVPTIRELYSLMRFDGSAGLASPSARSVPADARPYLDTRVFRFEYPSSGRYIDAQYLSRTPVLAGTMRGEPSFYGVNFADGRIKGYPQHGNMSRPAFYARYVRGNPDYGRNDLLDNGDATIRDRATGLTWAQADSGDASMKAYLGHSRRRDGSLDWGEALRYCASLELGGERDWRLPNAKELQSIVEYARTPAIDPLFRITATTNEAEERDFPYFWTSTTHLDGPAPGTDAVYFAFGQALGYMRPRGEFRYAYLDVHGPGAQRGDPKAGDPADHPKGHGPQGDIRRIYNHARCVRGGAEFFENPAAAPQRALNRPPPPASRPAAGPGEVRMPGPPAAARAVCQDQAADSVCTFATPYGHILRGVCASLPEGVMACVPAR